MLRTLLLLIALIIVIALVLVGTGIVNLTRDEGKIAVETNPVTVGTTEKQVRLPSIQVQDNQSQPVEAAPTNQAQPTPNP